MNFKTGDTEEYHQFYILLNKKKMPVEDEYDSVRYPQLVIHAINREIRKVDVLRGCLGSTYSYEWDTERYYSSINIE